MKDKEKIVRDLVNTFNDRDELHEAYKNKMKSIIFNFADEFILAMAESKITTELLIWEFVDTYVEERFKPEKE